jgi:hypothetical protein
VGWYETSFKDSTHRISINQLPVSVTRWQHGSQI